MRRILLVLTVALVMAAMVVATAGTAFAASDCSRKPTGDAPVNGCNHREPAPHFPNLTNSNAAEVTNCTTDPQCTEADVGAHHFGDFPPGNAPTP